jgi:hypothetical protein
LLGMWDHQHRMDGLHPRMSFGNLGSPIHFFKVFLLYNFLIILQFLNCHHVTSWWDKICCGTKMTFIHWYVPKSNTLMKFLNNLGLKVPVFDRFHLIQSWYIWNRYCIYGYNW